MLGTQFFLSSRLEFHCSKTNSNPASVLTFITVAGFERVPLQQRGEVKIPNEDPPLSSLPRLITPSYNPNGTLTLTRDLLSPSAWTLVEPMVCLI